MTNWSIFPGNKTFLITPELLGETGEWGGNCVTYCYFFLILGTLSLLTVAASSFLSLTSCSISVFSLFVLTIGCTLGFFLYEKNPKLRFLSLLVFPLAFWGIHDLPTAIGVTFITIYAVFVIFKSQVG